MNKYNVDINSVLVKPVLVGLIANVLLPAGMLLIAYYLNPPNLHADNAITNENISILFWIFIAVAIADGAVAIFLKHRLITMPLISRPENFAADLTDGVFRNAIICYGLTAAISLYGLVLYLIGGSFQQFLFFVIISFVAFQVIRARPGFINKVIEAQEKFVDQGRRPATIK